MVRSRIPRPCRDAASHGYVLFGPLGRGYRRTWRAPFLWLIMGALLAAISVWHDRRRIMRPAKRLKEETPSLRWLHPIMVPLAFLEIYVVAVVMATVLVGMPYWALRALHLSMNLFSN